MMTEEKKTSEKTLGLSPEDIEAYQTNQTESMFDTEQGQKRAGHFTAFLLGVLCCLILTLLATKVFGLGHFITSDQYDELSELDETLIKYCRIVKMIEDDPLVKGDPKELNEGMLKQLVANTGDPYAEYFTAEEYEQREKRYAGEFVGIGIGTVQDGDRILIKTVLEDSPAEDAGIKEGDEIVSVDGKTPEDVDDAIDMVSGKAGTRLTLTVRRDGELIDFTVNRAKIEMDSVGYFVVDDHPDIGYIGVASFIKSTDEDFRMAVKDLKAKGCDKFIIDLRNNGGGLTDQSIKIADFLLPECRIMSEKTKSGKETVYNSDASSADLDMVIVVNGNTASASEILTAALQDNGAGKVIGSKTYGKGVTQTVKPFKDGSAVKYTITEYFRPNGETVNGIGITPDIEVEEDQALLTALEELEDQ